MQTASIHGAPPHRPSAEPASCDDWLGRPRSEILALHDKACARLRRADAASGMIGAIAARLALLQQLIAARALVDVGAVAPDAARAAMRSDFAAGYLFGLSSAASCGADARTSPRRQRGTLLALHGVMFGATAARRLDRRWAAGDAILVGAAFGDGLLSAEADLRGFCRWLDARPGGAPPTALLDALPRPAWVGGAAAAMRQ
jgi:hypothetical protein